jgi:hypothetical protein
LASCGIGSHRRRVYHAENWGRGAVCHARFPAITEHCGSGQR